MKEIPRCRMCALNARWMEGRNSFGAYCAGGHCSNRERVCQNCEESFKMNESGAGTKYCSTKCKKVGYNPTTGVEVRYDNCCLWCGAPGTRRPGATAIWPYICESCTEPIKHVIPIFKRHHLKPEIAKEFMKDPNCAICGQNLLVKLPDPFSGKPRAALVIDHDHNCCTTAHSCGKCARGPLCNRCNQGIGFFKENIEILKNAIKYLENPPWSVK